MTVSWLLDANVVSEMMRFRPDGRVGAFLDSLAPQQVGFAAVTVWEVLNGIGRLEPGQRRRSLEHRFRSVVQEFGDRVVDWTLEDARTCAVIMEDKRRRGEPLDSQLADAFLAAAAVRRNLTIVTRNTRDFRNTGARTVNPWTVG